MEKKNGPWTIKNTEKVHENDFFTVYRDSVIQPDGKDGSYGIVDFPPGIGVLPVDDDGNVYLVKQFRYAVGRMSLEVLAGSIENGEEPLESAKREAKEEVGIEAETWTDFGQVDLDTTIVKNVVNFFLAQRLKIGKPEREGTEDRHHWCVPNARERYRLARSADRASLESHHLSYGPLQDAREGSSQPSRTVEDRRPAPPSA